MVVAAAALVPVGFLLVPVQPTTDRDDGDGDGDDDGSIGEAVDDETARTIRETNPIFPCRSLAA